MQFVAPDPMTGGIPAPGVTPGTPVASGSETNPTTVSTALARQLGQQITAFPGIYRGAGSMLQGMRPGTEVSGLDAPGEFTLFDGQFLHAPVRSEDSCVITDIQACNSVNGYVAARGPGSHFARCEFWNDPVPSIIDIYWNCHVFSAHGSHGCSSEEVTLFGWARSMLQNYKTDGVTDHTLWARYDGYPVRGNVVKPAYLSENISLTNAIIALGGTRDPRVDVMEVEDEKGVALLRADNPGALTSRVDFADLLIIDQSLGSIRTAGAINWAHGSRNTHFRNVHTLVPDGSRGWGLNGFGGGTYADCWASNDGDNRFADGWDQVGNFNIGIYRHDWPVLPESMWKRIERATEISGWPKAVRP